ncbi:Hypothetical protein Tpal_889 [Trichococcus palustris]|uniref:FRG domain-containing protein n=1 Tax=Trichococcus palustris TaxID=140314 RepID=A0A143YHS8_9LACT|nr:FRG domain-containing protein [Trichococcus palustris]CZQ87376.1 Hypothetical protein Tpal_889 [Trichococcus palustris]SFK79094.1 FRG domain-containing protein [Trichococcus palustris]
MKTDDVLVKMVEYAFFNDVVCINDFLDYYQPEKREVGRKRYETYIDNFVEKHLRPFIAETDNPLNGKFQIKSYRGNDGKGTPRMAELKKGAERDQENKQEIDFSNAIQKYYLVGENVEIRFITNLYDFLSGLQKKQKDRALEQIAEYEKTRNKTNLSPFRNTAEMEYTREVIFAHFQKELKNYYYRGQDSVNYKLLPRIYRESILGHEADMFDEWITGRPEEISDCRRHIDALRVMHQRGLATRLLDITSNPLAGLYYAVSQNDDYDGELIIFEVDSENQKGRFSDAVEIVSALATQSMKQKDELSKAGATYHKKRNALKDKTADEGPKAEFNGQKVTKKLIHEVRRMVGDFEPIIDPADLFKSFVIKPFRDEERKVRQGDSFILSGLEADGKNSPNLKYKGIADSIGAFRLSSEDGLLAEGKISRYVVPSIYKNEIRINLSVMGINEQYLFPESQSFSDYMKRQYL